MSKKILLGLSMMCVAALSFSACGNESNFEAALKDVGIDYDISLSIDMDDMSLKGEQTVIYENQTGQSLDYIDFHIYAKAFSDGVVNSPVGPLSMEEAYPQGESYGVHQVLEVKDKDGALETESKNVDNDILRIYLNSPLKSGKDVEIDIAWVATLPNINHRYGYGENTLNLGQFYPIAAVHEDGEFDHSPYSYNGDPFYSDLANYEVDINLIGEKSEGAKIVASGDLNDSGAYVAKGIRSFAAVISDDFSSLTEEVDGITLNYHYYNDQSPEKSLQALVDSVTTFNEMYGKYPYPSLSVVEANFLHGGMEFSNLVIVSDDISLYEDYIHTLVHEVAHQWWYGVVGNDEYKYGFLDESLTEYSALLFFEKNEGYGRSKEEMLTNTSNSYMTFVEVYTDVFGELDTSMDRDLNEYGTEPEYVYMAYVKGVLMLDGLREIIGDEKFMKALKYYYEENAGRNVTPEDLKDAFRKYAGNTAASYIESYINGKVVLEKVA